MDVVVCVFVFKVRRLFNDHTETKRFMCAGKSPVQHFDGHHQADVLPEPSGGPGQSHGNPEWASQTPSNTTSFVIA